MLMDTLIDVHDDNQKWEQDNELNFPNTYMEGLGHSR